MNPFTTVMSMRVWDSGDIDDLQAFASQSFGRHGIHKKQTEESITVKLKIIRPLALAALVVQIHADDKLALKDQKDKAGYSIGVNIGSSLKQDGVDVSLDALVAGLKDSFTDAAPQLTPEQRREALGAVQKEVTEKIAAQRKAAGDKVKKEGEDFLATNKAKDGVKMLPSGLQYKVLAEGKGPQPKPTDQVTVNYRGTLIDGTEFDSSYKRGKLATFPVNQVIKGWTEALPLMKTGAKWNYSCPANWPMANMAPAATFRRTRRSSSGLNSSA
jgi:FKBP-type peptidyl-prolyl cis-trans isomerase